MPNARRTLPIVALALAIALTSSAGPALAASATEIDRAVDAALKQVYATEPATRQLVTRAKAVLVFPTIYKAGFMFGAQYGEGAMRRQGKTIGYYNSAAASYGLQAGAQAFGYILFFMTDSAVKYLEETGGFELGSGPSIVVLDRGAAGALTTSTAQADIAAMFFDQKGLMGGLGIQGSKLSRMNK